MDQIHKDALRRTRVALVKDLDVNVICNELLNKDIFTPLMVEHIMVSCVVVSLIKCNDDMLYDVTFLRTKSNTIILYESLEG